MAERVHVKLPGRRECDSAGCSLHQPHAVPGRRDAPGDHRAARTHDDHIRPGLLGQLGQTARDRGGRARDFRDGNLADLAACRCEQVGSLDVTVGTGQPERALPVDVREHQLAVLRIDQALRERKPVAVTVRAADADEDAAECHR